MEKIERNNEEYYTVDLLHVVKTLWKNIWAVVLSAVLIGAIAFSYANFIIPPKYSSKIMLYVNNNSFALGNTSFSISASEITAAQSLVNTYSEILNNRTTLERVIEKSKVDYSYAQLAGMIKSQPSNETEIMVVTVTTENPYESAKIANTIAEVLPIRISEIIDGASMEVVDSAVPVLNKVSPSVTKYTALGMILGILISVAIITIIAIMDDTIRDEEYIIQNYKYPILAKVPDLLDSTPGRYGYYYKQSRKPKN
jgi:capsular polysaccharide biosynthesis protein